MLNKNNRITFLKSNKDLFKQKFNIVKIGLFGSYARNEQTEKSDIDIIVVFEDNTEELFDKRIALSKYIGTTFNKKVDVCYEQAIKPVFRDLIMKDAIYAF